MHSEVLTQREEDAQLRLDFAAFAQRCFRELNPLVAFAMNWHVEIMAAKLTAVYRGEIRRLIVNKAHNIDNIAFIFHPAVPGRSAASPLSTRVEYHATLRKDDLDAAIISSEASAQGRTQEIEPTFRPRQGAAISPGFDSQITPLRRGDKSRVRPKAMQCQGRDTRGDRSALF